MGDMYPRTIWLHALRAWFDGEIGPAGEQMPLPGMPEPPDLAIQRAWYLVVMDYAKPDGYLIAPRDQIQRRWRISPRTAEKYWQQMRKAGWIRLQGKAHTGHAQVRQLTIPAWAIEEIEEEPEGDGEEPTKRTVFGTPGGLTIQATGYAPGRNHSELGTPPGVVSHLTGYAPQGPPEVNQEEVNQSVKSGRLGLVTPGSDLTDDQQQSMTDEWLTGINTLTGLTLTPNKRTTAIAARAITSGWPDPAATLDGLKAAGHNLIRMNEPMLVTVLENLTRRPPTRAPQPPAATPVSQVIADLEDICDDHGGSLRKLCRTCKATA